MYYLCCDIIWLPCRNSDKIDFGYSQLDIKQKKFAKIGEKMVLRCLFRLPDENIHAKYQETKQTSSAQQRAVRSSSKVDFVDHKFVESNANR